MFPLHTDSWEENNDTEKTWSEWKETYLAAHKSRENCLRAADDADGNNFGTANSATTPNSDHKVTFQNRPPTIPYGTPDCLDSYLTTISDDVANAATAGSLDDADIYKMDKILNTPTLANATLVKEVA